MYEKEKAVDIVNTLLPTIGKQIKGNKLFF